MKPIPFSTIAYHFVVFALFAVASPTRAEFILERVSGPSETFTRFDVSNAVLEISGPPVRSFPLKDVVSLRRKGALVDWSQRTTIVWLSNGDRLIGEPTGIDEDQMTLRWQQFPASEPVTVPLEYVVAVCLQTPTSAGARQKLFQSLAANAERGDVAWLTSGDRVAGELLGLENGEFLLKTKTGQLPILRDKLLALRFDAELVAPLKSTDPRAVLLFSDGTRLTVQSFEVAGEEVSFTTAFGAKSALPLSALDSLHGFSKTVQPLSERKPAAVQFTPFLERTWNWAKDRNVLSGPLQLRGREFATGLGLHSRMQLTFPLEPNDREFRATVGIDDVAEGRGHAVFSVAVDDKTVWISPGLTGSSDPLAIPPVDLRGGKRLTLTVDFGEEGDVCDYADWGDAVIIRVDG